MTVYGTGFPSKTITRTLVHIFMHENTRDMLIEQEPRRIQVFQMKYTITGHSQGTGLVFVRGWVKDGDRYGTEY